MVEVDNLAGARVVAVVEIVSCVLERASRLDLGLDPKKHGPSVLGQMSNEMRPKCLEVQPVVDDQRRHAGATIGAGHADAVDTGFPDSGKLTERLRHFGGRYILALPAERVADPIDKIEITLCVFSHQIAGAKPRVSTFEYVAQDFFL